MKKIALVLLLALAPAGFAQDSSPLPVTPRTAYKLSFEAEGGAPGAHWVVHLRDAEGNLPFDGTLEGEWQQLTPEKKTYTHLFHTPEDAATFELLTQGSGVTVSNVKLEKWEPENLLLNGDFSEGLGNYSGWTERYNTELVDRDGRTILRVNRNGYALADYTPVVGGGSYQMKGEQGRPGYVVLIYDQFRNFIGLIEQTPRKPFELPGNAAYIRVMYKTSWAEETDRDKNEILRAELQELSAPTATPATVEKNSEWEIVLAPGSDPREEHAARELRHWITEITGKAPALLAEPGKGKTPKILVGRAWADAFGEDLKELEGSDGYAIRTKDGNIHIFGAHSRGSLYGVYALLERNTDIIWPRPNPEFDVLFTKTSSLAFPDANVLSRPTFTLGRDMMANAYGRIPHVLQDWSGRNGLSTSWELRGGNNYLVWLRGARLGYGGSSFAWALGEPLGVATGPVLTDEVVREEKMDGDIRPLVDGKRDITPARGRQPCYTHQGTVDGIVANIREAMKRLPGRDIEYMASVIGDSWTVCGCPNCLAPITLPNGETLTTDTADSSKNPLFFSTRHFMMLNKVAEALEKDFPNLRIQTHAYIFTAEPPKVKVHPMIIPEFAAYPTQNLRYPILSGKAMVYGSGSKDIWKRRFEQWGREKKGALGYFGYYHPEGFSAVADTAAEDWRDLAKFGGVQTHTGGADLDVEALSSWDADGIEKWVMAKLMWNPSQDPETLRKQYISRVYRGAEKEMTEFYKLIRDTWHAMPESVFINCHTSTAELLKELVIKQKKEKQIKSLLASAEKAASDPRSRHMIQRTLAYFEKTTDHLAPTEVPLVDESKTEWRIPSSPHWEKAAVIRDFKKVDDWRIFDKNAAEYPTTVKIMQDGENLYVRFDGEDKNIGKQVKPTAPAGFVFPNGDRFELRVKNTRNQVFYFTVGPGGHYFSVPLHETGWETIVGSDGDTWTGIMSIPLALLGTKEERSPLRIRLGRMARLTVEEREESSDDGKSIYDERNHYQWPEYQIQ